MISHEKLEKSIFHHFHYLFSFQLFYLLPSRHLLDNVDTTLEALPEQVPKTGSS